MGFLFITAQQTEKLIVPDSIQKAKFAETVEKIANMDLEKVKKRNDRQKKQKKKTGKSKENRKKRRQRRLTMRD